MTKHLLGIAELSRGQLETLLARAQDYCGEEGSAQGGDGSLVGRVVVNLFLEPSTRTRLSFEKAAKSLGAKVLNITGEESSIGKGETLSDMLRTVEAMGPDAIVLRHGASGAVHFAAGRVKCSMINAGDGAHEHPTQALLDLLTVQQAKGKIQGLKLAILGDVLHSRVARSAVLAFSKLGARVVVAGPKTLIPKGIESLGAEVSFTPSLALEDADVVMTLRVQNERMHGGFLPNTREYARWFGLNRELLSEAKPDAIVLHPGPMNRGVEIASDLADGVQSRILEQVSNGVAVRMAVLEQVIS